MLPFHGIYQPVKLIILFRFFHFWSLHFQIQKGLTQSQMKKWWQYFKYSNIDFIHTSNGNSIANSRFIENDENSLTWSFMTKLTQKRILADSSFDILRSGLESKKF